MDELHERIERLQDDEGREIAFSEAYLERASEADGESRLIVDISSHEELDDLLSLVPRLGDLTAKTTDGTNIQLEGCRIPDVPGGYPTSYTVIAHRAKRVG